MDTSINIGDKVVGEKDGNAIIGELISIKRGWALIGGSDGQVNVRSTTVELFEEDSSNEDNEHRMATKLKKYKEGYVHQDKTFHNGDPLAFALHGHDLYEVAKVGENVLEVPASELIARYEHLNPGQQRMNIGNRIRAVIKKDPELIDKVYAVVGKPKDVEAQ